MAIPVITVEDGTRVSGANSYQTLACFTNFIESRLGASDDVIALNSETKARGLITAYDVMQTLPWFGYRTYEDQEDAWPRSDVVDRRGRVYQDGTIPQALLFGQSLIAVALLDGRLIRPGMASPGYTMSAGGDGASIEFVAPIVPGDGCAPAATTDPLRVCGNEMLALVRGPNRSLKLLRA